MPDTNPVAAAAARRAEPSPLEGSGMVKDAADLATKVAGGDWAEGLLSLASFAYEGKDLLADPLAKLASTGLGWVVEFFAPLRGLLDQLTGNSEQLTTIVETWSGIAGELASAADDLHTSYTTASANWTGPAVTQYRVYSAKLVDLYRAASAAAQSVADNTLLSGAILTGVREVVRGLVTDAVGKAISTACRYPPPTTAAAAPEIAMVVTDAGNEIAQWIGKLERAFSNAKQLLGQSRAVFRKVQGALTAAVKEIPTQLPEMMAVEAVKATASVLLSPAGGPEPPADQSILHDTPGPHRVTGTL